MCDLEQPKIFPGSGWAAEERRKQEESDDEERDAPPLFVHVSEGDIIHAKGVDAVLCPLWQKAFRNDISLPASRRTALMRDGIGGRILSAAEQETAERLCLSLADKNPAITTARIPGLYLSFRWIFPAFLTDGTAENIARLVRNVLSAADWSGCASLAVPFFAGSMAEQENAALAIAGAVRNWERDHPARTIRDVWLIGRTKMEALLFSDASWADMEPMPERARHAVRFAGEAGRIRLETGTGRIFDTDTDAAAFLLRWDEEDGGNFSRCIRRACLPARHVLPGGSLITSGGILPVGTILASREALPVGRETPEDTRNLAVRKLLDTAERAGCRSISVRARNLCGADFARDIITRWSEEHPLSCLGTVRFVSPRPADLPVFRPEEPEEEGNTPERGFFRLPRALRRARQAG